MDGLHHSLVLAFCLHCKLENGKNSFFPHILLNRSPKVLHDKIHWTMLQIYAASRTYTSFFCENSIQVVNQLILAILFHRIINSIAILINRANFGPIRLENPSNLKHWLTHDIYV